MAVRKFTCGMGCFWGPQEKLSKLDGVKSCVAGYTGGTNPSPSYSSVCSGDGHVEAVQLLYDDEVISFSTLLQQYGTYWRAQNALPSKGSQYSPCLWLENKEELLAAEKFLTSRELEQHTVVLRSERPFYLAEGYHQNYEAKQKPRNLLLILGLALELFPGTTTLQNKAGAALCAVYAIVTLGERILQSKVVAATEK